MSRPRNASRIARLPLFALIVLLAGSSVGSIVMAGRARARAESALVGQARSAVDHTLSSIFSDNDLSAMSSPSRAATLNNELAVALGASTVSDVTLYSPSGTVLYDMENSRIGNKLAGERAAIKTASHGDAAATSIVGSNFTVVLSIQRFGTLGTVMLTMPKAPIDAAARPWTAAGLIMALAILPALFMLWWVGRITSAVGATISFRPRQHAAPAPARAMREPLRPQALVARLPVPVPAQHGLKEEGDARRMAEERAKSAEERLTLLQEQYRKTLDELHTLRDRAPAAVDGNTALEERVLQAEGNLRLLERQLAAVTEERDKLEDAVRTGAKVAELDPGLEAERARMEGELAGIRAELEGAQTELAAERRARAETVAAMGSDEDGRAERVRDLEEDLDAAHVQILATREALERAQAEAATSGTSSISLEREVANLRQAHDQAVRERDAMMLESREESEHLHRELEVAKANAVDEGAAREAFVAQTERIRELQQQLEATRLEVMRAEESVGLATGQADSDRSELAATRKELRALRNEEQRAAMLEDELRATRATLENSQASHRAELMERDADLEERVRRTREDFQTEIAATSEQLAATRTEYETALGELEQVMSEAAAAAEDAQRQSARAAELADRAERAERELHSQQQTARSLATGLEEAVEANTDLARKLQDLENRRQLELADEEGHLEMDQILYATQERLAGQTERLIEMEERAHEAERSVERLTERLDEAMSQLRSTQMAGALRDLRSEESRVDVAEGDDPEDLVRLEDRRASSPFLKELTLDAKKSLTQILGITQILKYKKDAKDQAQLVKQLTAYARRLDLTVSDLADADKLARGSVELTVRRTDLEALVKRVAAESDVGADHDLRIVTEPLVCGVDQLRTEQVLAGLLRASSDRTPTGKSILVTLQHVEGGALISVGDPEPSSGSALSPVVKRFAEIQGGWARVETREDGTGSLFRVFLPDGGINGAAAEGPTLQPGADLRIVVTEGAAGDESWQMVEQDMLVREIGRLAEPG